MQRYHFTPIEGNVENIPFGKNIRKCKYVVLQKWYNNFEIIKKNIGIHFFSDQQ